MPTKIPKLIEALAGYGIATEELIRRLEALKARFPQGDVPISLVEALVRQFVDVAVQERIILSIRDDAMQLFATGRSKVKRDDSALA